MKNKKTTEQFIKEAKEIHDYKYDYSLVDYINNKHKVKIICKKHGIFEAIPKNHLNGCICLKCSGSYKLTTNEWIEKSKEIHGDKYDYSLVNYMNNKIKVKIICKKHGIFEQVPKSHINGNGCIKCAGVNKLNTNDFIEKSIKIHGDKYDYTMVNYISAYTKIKIICKKHGIFEQIPCSHLFGKGCIKCSGLCKHTKEEFINKAVEIHGNEYIYDDINYINIHTKINIKCKKHDYFKQTPAHHLSGQMCPICNNSKGEIEIRNILKENNIRYKPQYGFADLKYKYPLKFDFGILDENNNLKYLIEYNGLQHYEYVRFMHLTENNYKIALYRDQLKQDYCIKNNIPLYVIRYDEDINLKLGEFINI